MNVALLIETLESGGAERVVQQLALGLRQRRHRTFVYCLKAGGPVGEFLRTHGIGVREAHSAGRDPLLAWRLACWLRSDRIDVANAHNSAATVWALPAAKLLGIPLIQTRHGGLLGRATRYSRLADRLVRFVDRVTIVSESLRSRLPGGRALREAVHLPNGVDCTPVPPRQARHLLERLCGGALEGPVVLSVGTVCAEKDMRGLLQAMAILRRELPRVRLICIGAVRETTYGTQVDREIHALKLTDCVHRLGPVNDAYHTMAGADVFCLSSRTEAMPIVLLEAMNQRVPIVATAVGDVGRLDGSATPGRYLLRHNETGLLVPPGNPAALAEALRYALRDRSAAQRRAGRAANDYARFYTGERMTQGYERVYTDCLRCCGRSASRRSPLRDKRRRSQVLMLGPAAPQIGGMVSVIDALMDSKLHERYGLHRLATTANTAQTRDDRRCGHLRRAAAKFASIARHLTSLARLARLMCSKRISLLHIHTCSYFSFYRNLLDLFVARLLGRPAVLHIHGGEFDRFCAGSGRLGRWLIRRGCQNADAVIVLSRQWRTWLNPYMGDARVSVVPNGITVSARQLRPDPEAGLTTKQSLRHSLADHDGTYAAHACRFLFLAALTARKGLADLIDAAALLCRDGIPFELLITGPATDDARSAWEQRVHQAGLQHVVTFTGPVMGLAKARLLASADCFVLPSLNEGLPVALLEAAAIGLPVIATAVGGIPEFMMPAEREAPPGQSVPLAPLIAPHDPATLAAEMSRLATDPERRRRIGKALRARVVADYGLDRQAERIARLYEQLIPQERARRAGSASRRCSPGTPAEEQATRAPMVPSSEPASWPVDVAARR